MANRYRSIRAKSFRAWFNANLKEYAHDIANHGADSGFPHITYNSEAARIFDRFASEIWEMATHDSDDLGHKNVAEMITGFKRDDMLDDWTTFRVLMVWYACERVARDSNP